VDDNQWLRAEIGTGLQKLLVLRLIGTPPEDAIVGTATVWLEAVEATTTRWNEQLDQARVQRAFKTLLRICDHWPAPKLFLDNLGNRDPPLALPNHITAAQQQENRARIRAIVKTFTQGARP
jgi:hypothetical protein